MTRSVQNHGVSTPKNTDKGPSNSTNESKEEDSSSYINFEGLLDSSDENMEIRSLRSQTMNTYKYIIEILVAD